MSFLKQSDFFRVFGRIVYHPRSTPDSQCGAVYRDLIIHRRSDHFCMIANKDLSGIEWGALAEPHFAWWFFKKLLWEIPWPIIFQEFTKEVQFVKTELYRNFQQRGNHENW